MVLRLSEKGAAALEREDPTVMRVLARRGLAHRIVPDQPLPPQAAGSRRVEVVVPVHDDEARLRRVERALATEHGTRLIVVDDGSSPPVPHASFRLPDRRGPAAARNAARGLLDPETELVCFLDADTEPSPGFTARLAVHFEDPQVGAVAPRVSVGHAASRHMARYEAGHSPLDMGERPGLVGAGRRLSYVPTAALVCRREALESVGWFDEALLVGEDVDLVRRFEAQGWDVRYEPSVIVSHDTRRNLGDFARQRFSYGTSAAVLDERHRGSVAPLRLPPLGGAALAGLLAAAVGRGTTRRAGAAVLLASTSAIHRRLSDELRRLGATPAEARREALRLTATSTGHGARALLVALRRVWWPSAAAVLAAPRLGKPAKARLTALLGASQLARRPLPASPQSALLGVLDDVAYGLGVWHGCVSRRTAGPLVPRLGRVRPVPSDLRATRGSPAAPSREPSSAAPRR